MNVWTWLATHKDGLEALKALLTAVALIVGAVWSYQIFVRKRLTYPRAKLEHRITSWKLPDGGTLAQVTIHIQNPSEVLLKLVTGCTWIQQIQPWPQEFMQNIGNGTNPVRAGESEIQWPLLGERDFDFSDVHREIEPGESDELRSDFLLPADVQQVLIYSYLRNQRKRFRLRFWKQQTIGWDISTTYDLTAAHACITPFSDKPMSDDRKLAERRMPSHSIRQGEPKPKPVAVQPPKPQIQGQPKPKPAPPPPKK